MDTTTEKTQRMRSGLPDELSIAYAEETELHWHRIISVLLGVLALLTLLGWVLMNSISAENAARVISADSSLVESESGEARTSAEVDQGVQELESAIPEVPDLSGSSAELEAGKPQSAVNGFTEMMLPSSGSGNGTAVTDLPPVIPANILNIATSEDPAQITLDPTYVASLQLTSDLENKSPTDMLGGEVNLGDQNLIKVYAYSELINLKGEQIYHEWYQGGERMARVPVGVYLDDMRASTSKYIDRSMTGDWHLKITRGNGEELGRMDFRVNVDS